MKPKIIGAVILAVTAAVAGMILLFTDKSQITALGCCGELPVAYGLVNAHLHRA